MLLERLIGLLLAAGGPKVLMDRSPWPLHQALRKAESRHGSCFGSLGIPLSFRQQDQTGMAAVGAAAAIFALIRKRVLVPSGTGLETRLHVDADALRPYRKTLMGLDPSDAQLLHDIAVTWAAYARTAENTWERALASRDAMSIGDTPNRRHLAAGVAF